MQSVKKNVKGDNSNWWKIKNEKCILILIEKQQKYCHQVKLININILDANKILLYQSRIIEE